MRERFLKFFQLQTVFNLLIVQTQWIAIEFIVVRRFGVKKCTRKQIVYKVSKIMKQKLYLVITAIGTFLGRWSSK